MFVQDDRLRSSVFSSENVIGSDQPVIIDTNVHHFMNGKREALLISESPAQLAGRGGIL